LFFRQDERSLQQYALQQCQRINGNSMRILIAHNRYQFSGGNGVHDKARRYLAAVLPLFEKSCVEGEVNTVE
jgi:hypothetical protein